MRIKNEATKRVPVYFPLDLLIELQESAKSNGRSFTKEVTQRLKQSCVVQEKTPDQVAARSGVVKALSL
jgi:Arc-like DNA binding domain.